MILKEFKATTTNPANITAGLLTVFSQANDEATQEVYGTIRMTNRASSALTELTVQIDKPTRYGEQSIDIDGVSSLEIPLEPILWRSGEVLTVRLLSDNAGDNAVSVVCDFYQAVSAANLQAGCPVERSPDDTNPITFSFPGPSLALAGTRSIDNGTYEAVGGAIAYLRTEGGSDLYTLAYNAADRPSAEGVVRYRFVESGWVDGDPERFVTLRIAVSGLAESDAYINVLPAVGIAADRSPGVSLTPVVGETILQSITLYATDGTTPISLAGKTLAIVFEAMSGIDVAVIANADITVSGTDSNVVTFAYPAAVTATERTLRFAIKDAAAPLTEYLKGICVVTSGPRVDA